MKAIVLESPAGIESLTLVERPDPRPAPGEVVVRVRACSLNYHDLVVVTGGIPTTSGRVPMSDGAGEVVAVGEQVTSWRVGDRVMSTFFPSWHDGPPDRTKLWGVPGDQTDGFAAQQVAMPASAFTRMPEGFSFEEAATLPCAGVTAWRALFVERPIKPGDWVLTQGTGGVSLFALMLAKAAGARVIATSSSPEKLERLEALGADHVINYKTTPRWGAHARSLTRGRGVDVVVETGGPGTLPQSIAACRIGGHIALIGVLTGVSGEVPTAALFSSNLTVSGITVGSHGHQLDLVAGLEATGVKPVIDCTFPLAALGEAFRHQASQRHVGKICLTVGD